MKRFAYALAAVAVLTGAGFMIYQALATSLVYFILPNEYAADPDQYEGRRIRLGGLVEAGTIAFDDESLHLRFNVTDSLETYPVSHRGTPPDMFQENTGVVIEGRFADDGVFMSDELLIRHSEVYQAPPPGEPVDVEALRESLR